MLMKFLYGKILFQFPAAFCTLLIILVKAVVKKQKSIFHRQRSMLSANIAKIIPSFIVLCALLV